MVTPLARAKLIFASCAKTKCRLYKCFAFNEWNNLNSQLYTLNYKCKKPYYLFEYGFIYRFFTEKTGV